MNYYFCILSRQDMWDFTNVNSGEKRWLLKSVFICDLKDNSWSKVTPRFLTVVLEVKAMPFRLTMFLDNESEVFRAQHNFFSSVFLSTLLTMSYVDDSLSKYTMLYIMSTTDK